MSINFSSRYVPTGEKLSGGLGDVIICQDQNLDRRVAIKFIQNIHNQRRLLDEIAALQKIRSKHVVQILDIIIENNEERRIGIVQEYLPGEDLLSVSQKKFSTDTYLKAIFQISSGISDIHAQGLIHRDIKPNNMKLDREGIIKIFDFGLARLVGINDATFGFRGTPGFAAPELYRGGPVFFTKAIDTYAFGATAYFLAEEKLPQELLDTPPKRTASTPSFTSLSVNIPKEIAEILDSTLSENIEERPMMADIRDTIARYLLLDKHRSLLVSVSEGRTYILDKERRTANINIVGIGSIEIKYDGLIFFIESVSGEIFVNNSPVNEGQRFPNSCVITIGNPERGRSRGYVTFDMSHPEVVL